MVSPVGSGRLNPLLQAAGAAGPGAAAPAPAPAAAATPPAAGAGTAAARSSAVSAAAAAPGESTIHEGLRFVAALWVPIIITDTEGKGSIKSKGKALPESSLRAQDERLNHWYYPRLGTAIAAGRPAHAILKKMGKVLTPSQLIIAINKYNEKAAIKITGNDMKRAAIELDKEFLPRSIKICLENIIFSKNHLQAVDADYYEGELYRMLTSGYRSGASRAAVIPHVMTALASVRAKKDGSDAEKTAAAIAATKVLVDAELENAAGSKYMAFKISAAVPASGAGAAPSSGFAGYPARAIDLAKELVRMKAVHASEVLTESQVNERAVALLKTNYKGYEEFPSQLIIKMEADLAAISQDTSKPAFVLGTTYGYFSSKDPYSVFTLSGKMNPKKPFTFWTSGDKKTSIIVKKAEVNHNSGKKEKQGLYPGAAYVGDLWMMENEDEWTGVGQLALKYATTGGHKFSVGGGYSGGKESGALGFLGGYDTPSLMSKDDLHLGVDVFIATKLFGTGGWTPKVSGKIVYEQAQKTSDVVNLKEAKLEAEFLSKSGSVSSQVVAGGLLSFGADESTTLEAKYRRLVVGDTFQEFSATLEKKMNDAFTLKFEGTASSGEKTVLYGSPNSGVSIDGTELLKQPSALDGKMVLSGIASLEVKAFDCLKFSIGGGVTNNRTSVEDQSQSDWVRVVQGGVIVSIP